MTDTGKTSAAIVEIVATATTEDISTAATDAVERRTAWPLTPTSSTKTSRK
jgi:hypothetical protein